MLWPARQARLGGRPGGTPRGGRTVTPAPANPLRERQAALHYAHLSPFYAHLRSLDSPGLLHVVDCPLYICLFLSVVPCVSIIVVMSFSSPCPDTVLPLFDVHFSINCSLPVLASHLWRWALQEEVKSLSVQHEPYILKVK